jgi:hypothetical protein
VLVGPDNPQLRSIKVDVRDERSVADALADAYGAVNAVSLYLERGQETFHSSLPNGSPLRRSEAGSNGSFMFRGLAPILARNRFISESAVKTNWRFGKPLLIPF